MNRQRLIDSGDRWWSPCSDRAEVKRPPDTKAGGGGGIEKSAHRYTDRGSLNDWGGKWSEWRIERRTQYIRRPSIMSTVEWRPHRITTGTYFSVVLFFFYLFRVVVQTRPETSTTATTTAKKIFFLKRGGRRHWDRGVVAWSSLLVHWRFHLGVWFLDHDHGAVALCLVERGEECAGAITKKMEGLKRFTYEQASTATSSSRNRFGASCSKRVEIKHGSCIKNERDRIEKRRRRWRKRRRRRRRRRRKRRRSEAARTDKTSEGTKRRWTKTRQEPSGKGPPKRRKWGTRLHGARGVDECGIDECRCHPAMNKATASNKPAGQRASTLDRHRPRQRDP